MAAALRNGPPISRLARTKRRERGVARRPDKPRPNPHPRPDPAAAVTGRSMEFLPICPLAVFYTREVGNCFCQGPFLAALPAAVRGCGGAGREGGRAVMCWAPSLHSLRSLLRSIPVMRFGNCSDLVRWPPSPQLLREKRERERERERRAGEGAHPFFAGRKWRRKWFVRLTD